MKMISKNLLDEHIQEQANVTIKNLEHTLK